MLELNSCICEVMKQYQKKLGIVNEIYRLTQEIDQLLAVNDRGSTQLVLEMRQEEMDKAERCATDIGVLEESMTGEDRNRLNQILKAPNGEDYIEKPEERKILEIDQHIKQVLQKTIELDKRLNMRIAGKDSFYNQRK